MRIVRMNIDVRVDDDTAYGLLTGEGETFNSVCKIICGESKEEYASVPELVDFRAEEVSKNA